MMLFSRTLLLFFLLFLCMICSGASNLITAGVEAINEGQLKKARAIFEKISADQTASALDRAVAYKNLGTIMFRLGESPDSAFGESEKLFSEALKANPSQIAKEQYGFMLYQKANCLLSICEQQLCKDRIQGAQAIPFSYLKKYIHPASESLRSAKKFYTPKQFSDIGLLEIELYLTESHVWQTCKQHESSQRAIEKAIVLTDKTLSDPDIAPDTKEKLLLRKAQLLLERNPDAPPHNEIRGIFETALKLNSHNEELRLSVFAFYVKYLLRFDLLKTDDEFVKIECDVKSAIEKLEALRAANISSRSFTASKDYFASRTDLYEALVMFYARRSRPFDMLLALNQIRSRAMQDIMVKEKITNMAQLQDILAKNRGMLIAYYVGVDHIWSVRISGSDAKISCSKISGQELVAACRIVMAVYSSDQYLRLYLRYGSGCDFVTSAFAASNVIYRELFEDCLREFCTKKCEHLYIMPNHVLNYLPFAALVTKHDDKNVFHDSFVADSGIPITYLPSVNSIATGRDSTGSENIIFSRAHYSYPALYNCDKDNPDNPNAPSIDLPGVEKEVETVAKLLQVKKSNIFREHEASEYNLLRLLSTPRSIVHIASHAHLNGTSPLDSYVVLAAGNGEDGKMSVRELLSKHQSRFNVGLLVLSACNTNRGEEQLSPGDDIAALSNAFIVAGCDSVISTQWMASDQSFPMIMEIFYHNLEVGMANDTALAVALKTFRDQARTQGQEPYLHPLFWGNIVLTGKKQ